MTGESFSKSLALIGAGRWGKNLARNFHALGVLHTLCDVNENLLDAYQEEYPDVNMTSCFTTVFENPEIDKVAIAAPAAHHYILCKRALEAGKDVFVEKPLCLDYEEGQELIDIAERCGRILMVGHLLQYHPCMVKLHELIAQGEIGNVQYVTSNRLNLGLIRTEENVLWSFAPHDISIILSLCGNTMPQEVCCSGDAYTSKDVVDISLMKMKFESDVRAHIYVSWLHPYKEQKLVVIGSEAMAVFDDTKPWDDKLLLYRNPITMRVGQPPNTNKEPPEKVFVPYSEPLHEECKHFVSCCASRTSPRTNGSEGLRVLRILQAAQDSLHNNGTKIYPVDANPFFAHDTAVIDSGATIGKGTKVWHFSHIMNDARIGEKCNIGQNVVVSPGVTLGDNVKVQNNVSIYSGVTCEDDVFLGPSMVFTNIKNPRSAISRRDQYVATIVRRGATIGANATILCGIEIGEYAFVGAGAVVTKDVLPHAVVVGNPARQVGWMNKEGEMVELQPEIILEEALQHDCHS